MFNKLFNMLGKTKPNQGNPAPASRAPMSSLPESVVTVQRQIIYKEAHANFPENLFANPASVIEAISKGVHPGYNDWTKRTLKTGKTVYLYKYPEYPIRSDQPQAGVGAVIVDPSDPSKPEYLVLNVVRNEFGPRVRRIYLNEEGSLCSHQDGPGCENSIEAFFQLLDSGKSGMEREREETRKRLESQGVKFDDA